MSAPGPHILLLAPGSKVALTRALAEATTRRAGHLSAWESDAYSPAAQLCHGRIGGGPIEDAEAVHLLLARCREQSVRLVVPSRHGDLPALAAARQDFAAAGITLAVSDSSTIDLCSDKVATHAWLQAHQFPTPAQATLASIPPNQTYPLIAKDPRGSGSRQVRLCRQASDLADLPPHWIAQSVAPGIEYTINTYVDRAGRSLCEIPHERQLVAEGEVIRARTDRIPALMQIARRISEQLPGARGPLNIQIFWDAPASRATVIEINPRFGGGYPLAHEAGGNFAEWLLAEYIDGVNPARLDSWETGLQMARYREAAFFRPAR